MIHNAKGNLLEADAEALVNTVNTVGVMGRGVALQMSRAFPEIVQPYQEACDNETLAPGTVLTVARNTLHNPKYIINVPTKRHWKGDSRIEDVESGLLALAREIDRLDIKSIAVPPLGCGLGGLAWHQVYPRIVSILGRVPGVDVYVYEPIGAPAASEMSVGTPRPRMTIAQAVLLGLMQRYLEAMMDEFVTLLEIHKLMYLMQFAGERLRLNFVKGAYGPYAKNLGHVLKRIEGHFIVGFGDGSEEPGKVIKVEAEAATEAVNLLASHEKTRSRMRRVAELIEGFESPYGMELLASVHWVAQEDKKAKTDPAAAAVGIAAWNARKKEFFEERHIRIAWDRLRELNWLTA